MFRRLVGRARNLSTLDDGVGELPTVARAVQRLNPYEPTASLDEIQALPGTTPFKLDWNEATVPPSPRVLEAIARFLANSHNLNWYPELYSKKLADELGRYTGASQNNLLVTNGSDDALALVCGTFLDPADEVVVPFPTYTHFLVFAQSKGGRVVPVRYADPFEKQLDRVLAAITPRTKLIYLVSPNNPTGLVYEEQEVLRVLAHAPHAVVIVDEAYFEFCGRSVVHLVHEHPNLIVTRTFSKSFGLAGLRVGYLVAHPKTHHELTRLFNPKSVNVLGQVAARAALQDIGYVHDYVAEVREAMGTLVDFFRAQGLEAHPTEANYLMVRLPNAPAFCGALRQRGVYVRDRSTMEQLEGFVRMNVGTREQTAEIIARMEGLV